VCTREKSRIERGGAERDTCLFGESGACALSTSARRVRRNRNGKGDVEGSARAGSLAGHSRHGIGARKRSGVEQVVQFV